MGSGRAVVVVVGVLAVTATAPADPPRRPAPGCHVVVVRTLDPDDHSRTLSAVRAAGSTWLMRSSEHEVSLLQVALPGGALRLGSLPLGPGTAGPHSLTVSGDRVTVAILRHDRTLSVVGHPATGRQADVVAAIPVASRPTHVALADAHGRTRVAWDDIDGAHAVQVDRRGVVDGLVSFDTGVTMPMPVADAVLARDPSGLMATAMGPGRLRALAPRLAWPEAPPRIVPAGPVALAAFATRDEAAVARVDVHAATGFVRPFGVVAAPCAGVDVAPLASGAVVTWSERGAVRLSLQDRHLDRRFEALRITPEDERACSPVLVAEGADVQVFWTRQGSTVLRMAQVQCR